MRAFSALGLNMTLNEYTHVEQYKYLYDIEGVKKGFDDCLLRHGHKPVSTLSFLVNPFIFFFSCKR